MSVTKITRCKWCTARIGKPSFKIDDEWTTLPSPVHLLGEELLVTDGICPDCMVSVKEEIRAIKKAKDNA